MAVQVLSNDQARGALARLANKTPADDLRDALCRAEIAAHGHQATLTNKRGSLYGDTYWMVSAAEWLEAAEAEADSLRAQLDALGEPHRLHAQTKSLVIAGVLPRGAMRVDFDGLMSMLGETAPC